MMPFGKKWIRMNTGCGNKTEKQINAENFLFQFENLCVDAV